MAPNISNETFKFCNYCIQKVNWILLKIQSNPPACLTPGRVWLFRGLNNPSKFLPLNIAKVSNCQWRIFEHHFLDVMCYSSVYVDGSSTVSDHQHSLCLLWHLRTTYKKLSVTIYRRSSAIFKTFLQLKFHGSSLLYKIGYCQNCRNHS